MQRLIKFTLYTLVFLFLLTLTALFFITRLIDANQYKDTLAQQVSQITGRPFTIAGDLEWHVLPQFELSANNISLGNPKGYAAGDFVKAQRLNFSVQLLPLVYGNIRVDKISLEQPQITLLLNAQGQANWSNLGSDQTPETATTNDSGYFKMQSLKISNFAIENGQVIYNDKLNQQSLMLEGVNLKGDMAFNNNITQEVSSVLPVNLLRRLNGAADLTIAQLKTNKLRASNVYTRLSAQNGIVSLKPFRFTAYDGEVNSEINLDVRGVHPQMRVSQTVEKLDSGKLFSDLDYKDRIIGTLQGNLKLETNNVDSLPNSLQGNASIEVDNGFIQGIDLLHAVRLVNALVQGKTLEVESNNKTPFKTLTGDIIMKNGVAQNDDLRITTNIIDLSGKGTLNFVTKTIDYAVKLMLKAPAVNNEIKKLQDAMGGIPMEIRGSFSNYKVSPEFAEITKAVTKILLKKHSKDIEKIGKEVGGKVKEEMKNLLDNF